MEIKAPAGFPPKTGVFMKDIGSLIKEKRVNPNVNVVNNNNIYNNVYDDNVASKIREALDKPKAIGEILADKLDTPKNLKFYIKLAYLNPPEFLFECLALTEEAAREGRIRTSKAQYFYGVVRKKKGGI